MSQPWGRQRNLTCAGFLWRVKINLLFSKTRDKHSLLKLPYSPQHVCVPRVAILLFQSDRKLLTANEYVFLAVGSFSVDVSNKNIHLQFLKKVSVWGFVPPPVRCDIVISSEIDPHWLLNCCCCCHPPAVDIFSPQDKESSNRCTSYPSKITSCNMYNMLFTYLWV